ncbi:hypothetical protein [Cryobacterium sp. GrIS_2_6]|uniref:general stress protein n=1 Tax=Cryobacterium sp. GrIS_2_6 TaxID=3162785 RepID=UPI002DFF6BC6|nr:general stress protein YciG [Cryobacterium psychrotolerans]
MPGNQVGGLKARDKNLASDPDFYKKIGRKGGSNGKGPDYQKGGIKAAGFAANPELARVAGAKGGYISKRRPAASKEAELVQEEAEPAVAKHSIWNKIVGRNS